MADEDVSNDGPLTLSEAVKAYSAPEPTEEIQEDHPEAEDGQDSETAEDELPSDEEGEDEGEPSDDEDQAEDDEESDSEEEVESDQGRFVSDNAKVKLPDGTVTTIAELKAGSLKNADYTQKTQALAEKDRAVTVQSERVKQAEQQVSEQANYVADLLRTVVPAEPNPAMLDPNSSSFDPVSYWAQEASRKQWVAHLTYLDQQKQQATEASQAEAAKAEQDKASTEWEALVEKVPELKDPKRNDAFVADLIKAGNTYGFSPQELRVVALDHRQALVMKDAIAFRKLQAAKAKNTTETPPSRPPVQKGSKRHSAEGSRHRAANSALERLNKSGSLKDGVAAYLATQSKG